MALVDLKINDLLIVLGSEQIRKRSPKPFQKDPKLVLNRAQKERQKENQKKCKNEQPSMVSAWCFAAPGVENRKKNQ